MPRCSAGPTACRRIEYHLPVFARDPIGRGRNLLFMRRRLDDLFKQLYRTSIIDRGAPVLGNVLRLVADPANLPLLFHCTNGKDRTGITAALLLYICGVPRETIMADYTLTNRAAERMLAGLTAMYGSRTSLGLKPEHLYPLFSARRELIELAFAHIEATYGTVDAYLRGPVGLTEAEIDAIRQPARVTRRARPRLLQHAQRRLGSPRPPKRVASMV